MEKQAGAELCQAQFKLGLAKPAIANEKLANWPAMLVSFLSAMVAYLTANYASLLLNQLC
jgi:hypothetical protein